MRNEYQNPTIRQLCDQQVRFAPRERKLEQVERAERLMNELVPDRMYSYEYLCYRITDYRPETTPSALVSGREAGHDLRLFVEDVSDASNVRAEEVTEAVHTVEDLSRLFNVSTKTISRWRQQGLVSRRFLIGGRKRLGFLQSSVDRFVSHNRERVQRGAQFSQLSDEERDEIVDRARRLSRAGGCPSEVARRIARHMRRSVETVRYTLRQFDQAHPEIAVFPDLSGPLIEESKARIYEQYRRGISVEALAKKHCRTRATVYRVINEMRAKRIWELPLDYIDNEHFAQPGADKEILGPPPQIEKPARRAKAPAGLPPYLASLYEVPLLTREEEQYWFRKFNFLKYKASKLREKLDPARAKSSLMDRIERLYAQAVEVKNRLVQSNLRLVVSIAKRHVGAADDFFELVSDGNMSLIRAVEKFDYARGNKFSTYASWAVMKNFARTIPHEFKLRDRFRTSAEEMFVSTEDTRGNPFQEESDQLRRELQIDRILSRLDEREQQIIISRFGLDHAQEPQTLKEVGADLGVTKERIRQLEARALNKLRVAVQEEKIELPD